MDKKEQDIIITFVGLLMRSLEDFFKPVQIEEIIGGFASKEFFLKINKRGFLGGKIVTELPPSFLEEDLKKAVQKIVDFLFQSFGFDFTESRLEQIYNELEKGYSIGFVGQMIIPYIPKGYLERHRIQYLSKEELEAEVLKKTEELRKLNDSLEDRIKARTLELTQANEKLMELDKIKSDFISVAAHQMRTPLSGIKWTLSMLLKGDLGALNGEQSDFLQKTFDSNNRMITLVNDMLVADGIQSGRVRYGSERIDLPGLIDNIFFEVKPAAMKRDISIGYKNEKSKLTNLPLGYSDKEAIYTVLQNLLENAIKYTIKGGKVEIDVQKNEGHLVVSVADNGIGIPADQQKNLFTKFFRARNAVKQETDGSGLGLYIAKETIEKNGGKLWFESTEGKGSTFYFTVLKKIINNKKI